jgi:crossover junction endodeoxyribonuclease RuvC
MRILGVDCGTERTGYAVIESDGCRHRLIVAGVVTASPRLDFSARLLIIATGLRDVIRTQCPDCAAVEEVFHAVNARTAIKLSHARGVALLTIAEAGVALGEYSPLEVKTSVVGYGRAEKFQVQQMVQSILGLDAVIASEDASDAAAIAICHATREASRVRVGA